jgi:hypothetical protein
LLPARRRRRVMVDRWEDDCTAVIGLHAVDVLLSLFEGVVRDRSHRKDCLEPKEQMLKWTPRGSDRRNTFIDDLRCAMSVVMLLEPSAMNTISRMEPSGRQNLGTSVSMSWRALGVFRRERLEWRGWCI